MSENIKIAEAVRRLTKYFSSGDIVFDNYRREWRMVFVKRHDGEVPDWIRAVENGEYRPSAIKAALDDLFISILEGDV